MSTLQKLFRYNEDSIHFDLIAERYLLILHCALNVPLNVKYASAQQKLHLSPFEKACEATIPPRLYNVQPSATQHD